jgi:hypothetical protein
MEEAVFLARIIVVGVLIVIFAYALARGVSFAIFRTKLEHWRRIMREMKEGDKRDGV